MLTDLSVKQFLDKTAGNEPVPGGGSISALSAALSAALTEMVANLTIGKKKYLDKEDLMKQIAKTAKDYQNGFVKDIDADADAYNKVFDAFKLPKDTEEQQALRSEKIQEATKIAAEVPMQVAKNAYSLMDVIVQVAKEGNQNAITDACVAMMAARTAVLGALLNVRINLGSIKDLDYVQNMAKEADFLEKQAILKEKELLDDVKKILE
ncbi:MAG: cyclodeaminase/cyclohydrolase family protein [Dysgonomonas sp.]